MGPNTICDKLNASVTENRSATEATMKPVWQ
jgi:hypothetical protein